LVLDVLTAHHLASLGQIVNIEYLNIALYYAVYLRSTAVY